MMNNSKQLSEQPLHCGKWTPEEEAYVQCLIEEFQAGYLPIREGTSLRSFLSKMLNCKPKRISKKFEGSDYNGKQVYVSQPYKLTAEEARERRDRLCTLEKKFHQSVAELKNAEGMKQQPYVDEPLDAAVVAAGLDTLPMGASAASTSFPSAASMAGGAMNMNHTMGNSMSNINTMNAAANAMNNPNDLGGQNQGLLDELAFQESMMRLRAQQQQQQQQLQQQQQQLEQLEQQHQQDLPVAALAQQQQQQQQPQQLQQEAQGLGGGGGSYVDPILGSLALSQNAVNTTPLTASHQYWRRQALLEASSHLDSIRMAQAGAIGIQRPSLEPGGLRDLRVPMPATNGGMQGGFGDLDASGFDSNAVASLKKRSLSGTGNVDFNTLGKGGQDSSNNSSNKRMRRSNDLPDASKLGRFSF